MASWVGPVFINGSVERERRTKRAIKRGNKKIRRYSAWSEVEGELSRDTSWKDFIASTQSKGKVDARKIKDSFRLRTFQKENKTLWTWINCLLHKDKEAIFEKII